MKLCCYLLVVLMLLGTVTFGQDTLRVNVDLVNVLFTVTDKRGKFITSLEEKSFRVFENDRRETITNFSKETNLPLAVALLIDTSGSVRDKLAFERDAASEFFHSILRREKDKALLIGFDSGVDLLQDFTDDADLLAKSGNNLRSGGGTSLFDAMFLATTQKLAGQSGRKVLILITDGDDNSSRLTYQETLVAIQKNEVVVYAISTNASALGGNEVANGDKVLKRFTEQTGGRFIKPTRLSDLVASFSSIGDELRSQYTIAYQSSNPLRDGSYRKIRIEALDKSLRVRARPGYYSPIDKTGK
jgi:Ca-activated chloride channel family protein